MRRLLSVSALGVPSRSLDFVTSGGEYLSIADAVAGGFNKDKCSWSTWFKRATLGAATEIIFAQNDNSAPINGAYQISFNSANALDFRVSDGTTALHGRLITTATYTNTTTWKHLQVIWDRNNGTANNRMRVIIDGTEVTSFSSRTNPTNAMNDSAHAVTIGATANNANHNTGKLYQPAMFSNVIPATTSLINGTNPRDLRKISGLFYLLHTNSVDALEDDYVLGTNWTNNVGVVKSTDIP